MGLMATTNLFLINLMKFIVDMVSPEKLRRCFKIAEMIYRVELLSCGSRRDHKKLHQMPIEYDPLSITDTTKNHYPGNRKTKQSINRLFNEIGI
jgi:hypothetical protein